MMRPLMLAACCILTTAVAFAQEPAQGGSTQDPATTGSPVPAAAATVAAAVAPAKGDVVRGQQLTYTCQGCHGITGYKNAYPSYHVPKIGGQSSEYLLNALIGYREGTRKHPTMQAQAQSFSDQDIADITAFLSSVK